MKQHTIEHSFYNSKLKKVDVRYKSHEAAKDLTAYTGEIFIDDYLMVKGKNFLKEPTVKDSLQYIEENNVEP